MNAKQIFWRAVKTAVQTFGGLMGAVGAGWLDADALKMAGVAAITAALSVVWNAVMTWAHGNEVAD